MFLQLNSQDEERAMLLFKEVALDEIVRYKPNSCK